MLKKSTRHLVGLALLGSLVDGCAHSLPRQEYALEYNDGNFIAHYSGNVVATKKHLHINAVGEGVRIKALAKDKDVSIISTFYNNRPLCVYVKDRGKWGLAFAGESIYDCFPVYCGLDNAEHYENIMKRFLKKYRSRE